MSRFPNNNGRGGRGRNSGRGGRSNNRSLSNNTNFNRNNQRNDSANRQRNRVNNSNSIPSTTAQIAKHQSSTTKCDPIYDASNPAAYLIWQNKSLKVLIAHLGLTEYFEKGTHNGKTL